MRTIQLNSNVSANKLRNAITRYAFHETEYESYQVWGGWRYRPKKMPILLVDRSGRFHTKDALGSLLCFVLDRVYVTTKMPRPGQHIRNMDLIVEPPWPYEATSRWQEPAVAVIIRRPKTRARLG